jgi:hypothetical protein
MARPQLGRFRTEQPESQGAFSIGEAIGVVLAISIGFHFLSIRIRGGGLPSGDEGSWIAVATELAHGNGFTTRWLEAHFLLPYTLPRPDDFRYPMLTSLLALAFKIGGFSVETARWTVASIFLAFATTTYFVSRIAFGRWAAMAALWLTVASLLQLEWNATVYTEGMFGLICSLVIAWCLWGERSLQVQSIFGFRAFYWWAILGMGVGLLYLVRVNGILFLPGVLWLYWKNRNAPLSWKHPTIAIFAFSLVIAPWLIRTAMSFGNPFHFAGSGGLLREPGQSHTLSIAQYFATHDVFFPIVRIVSGARSFFATLHFFEHGLEVIPLLLFSFGIFLRRPFVNPFMSMGFLVTFAACAYASYNNWAGLRYMSGMLPFVYAYGLSVLPSAWTRNRILFVLGIFLLLLPVVGPHRFYERKYSGIISRQGAYPYHQDLRQHLATLASLLPSGGHYYARSLCNVNFLLPDRGCIGLQELYDPTWLSRSWEAFSPSLIALTHAEIQDSVMRAAFTFMRSKGYTQDTLESDPFAVYFSVSVDSAKMSVNP